MRNVYDVYAKPAVYISREVDVKYAAKMMINHNIKRLLVINNNDLEGIISMTDIVESILERLGEK